MKPLPLLTVLIASLALFACSSISVSADYDPAADFSALRTWSWIPEEAPAEGADPRVGNSLVSDRVTAAIDRTLQARGYQEVEQSSDFQVGFSIGVRIGLESAPSTSASVGYGRYGRYGGIGYGTGTEVREYEEGTLVIDLIDPATGKLIWRGTAQARVSSDQSPESSTKRINEAVEKVLAQFPPS